MKIKIKTSKEIEFECNDIDFINKNWVDVDELYMLITRLRGNTIRERNRHKKLYSDVEEEYLDKGREWDGTATKLNLMCGIVNCDEQIKLLEKIKLNIKK